MEIQTDYIVHTSKCYLVDAILFFIGSGLFFGMSALIFFSGMPLIGMELFVLAGSCMVISIKSRKLATLQYVFSEGSLRVYLDRCVQYSVNLQDYTYAYFLPVSHAYIIAVLDNHKMTLLKQWKITFICAFQILLKPCNRDGIFIVIRPRDFDAIQRIFKMYISNVI